MYLKRRRLYRSSWIKIGRIHRFCTGIYDRVEATLGDVSEAELKAECRLKSGEINLLFEALSIPESFACINGTVATGLEGRLMFLKHFGYLCRLGDMIALFDRSIPELCLILRGSRIHCFYPWPSPLRRRPAQALTNLTGVVRPGVQSEGCCAGQLLGICEWYSYTYWSPWKAPTGHVQWP